MTQHMDHEDVMELAVQLTCSYLSSSHSATTNAEEMILEYYRQIRRVEVRLHEDRVMTGEEAEESEQVSRAA